MTLYTPQFFAVMSFLFGLAVGSFLNVVIIRVPQGLSVIHPPSHCPRCGSAIGWYDNIPVLSWFLLKGQCRYCRGSISSRYALVEFLTACVSLGLFLRWGPTATFFVYFVLAASLIAVFWIDLDHMIIPDAISLNGLPVGIAAAISGLLPGVDWKLSLIGVVVGAAILYIPALVYEAVRGVQGLGGGDIKLLAMIGAFLGPHGVFFVLLCSSLTGSLVGVTGMLLRRTHSTSAIPFGPFLSGAALVYLFVGQRCIDLFLVLIARTLAQHL